MSWVADTCLLLDVLDADPIHGIKSAALLDEKSPDGLVVCPITFIELAPAFNCKLSFQEEFLQGLGASFSEPWTETDTHNAWEAWGRYIALKKKGKTGKRPIADLLIGSFALRFQGLLTRNKPDFQVLFPTLKLL